MTRLCAKCLTHSRWSLSGCGWSPAVLTVGRGALVMCSRTVLVGRLELSFAYLAVRSHCTPLQAHPINRSLVLLLSESHYFIDSPFPCPSFSSCSPNFSTGIFELTSGISNLYCLVLCLSVAMITARPNLASSAHLLCCFLSHCLLRQWLLKHEVGHVVPNDCTNHEPHWTAVPDDKGTGEREMNTDDLI